MAVPAVASQWLKTPQVLWVHGSVVVVPVAVPEAVVGPSVPVPEPWSVAEPRLVFVLSPVSEPAPAAVPTAVDVPAEEPEDPPGLIPA